MKMMQLEHEQLDEPHQCYFKFLTILGAAALLTISGKALAQHGGIQLPINAQRIMEAQTSADDNKYCKIFNNYKKTVGDAHSSPCSFIPGQGDLTVLKAYHRCAQAQLKNSFELERTWRLRREQDYGSCLGGQLDHHNAPAECLNTDGKEKPAYCRICLDFKKINQYGQKSRHSDLRFFNSFKTEQNFISFLQEQSVIAANHLNYEELDLGETLANAVIGSLDKFIKDQAQLINQREVALVEKSKVLKGKLKDFLSQKSAKEVLKEAGSNAKKLLCQNVTRLITNQFADLSTEYLKYGHKELSTIQSLLEKGVCSFDLLAKNYQLIKAQLIYLSTLSPKLGKAVSHLLYRDLLRVLSGHPKAISQMSKSTLAIARHLIPQVEMLVGGVEGATLKTLLPWTFFALAINDLVSTDQRAASFTLDGCPQIRDNIDLLIQGNGEILSDQLCANPKFLSTMNQLTATYEGAFTIVNGQRIRKNEVTLDRSCYWQGLSPKVQGASFANLFVDKLMITPAYKAYYWNKVKN